MDQLNTALIGFLTSLPVWGIIGFLLLRTIKNRDKFENKTSKELEDIKDFLAEVDKKLAVITKDIEYSSSVSKTVGELSERVSKMHYDIDNCFAKIRELRDQNV